MEILSPRAGASAHETSAAAAAEFVNFGAGQLSFELLLPVDLVIHSDDDRDPPRDRLETVGWGLLALMLLCGVRVAWGLRGADCWRSARWANPPQIRA